jgi:hypothetical protein
MMMMIIIMGWDKVVFCTHPRGINGVFSLSMLKTVRA